MGYSKLALHLKYLVYGFKELMAVFVKLVNQNNQ